ATLLGSGLNHRNLNQDQRAELAAQVVCGERPFVPSAEQMSIICHIPRYLLARHLKARRENGGNGNGADTDFLDHAVALKGDVGPEKLVEVFSQVAAKLGIAKALDVLASIERANSEI